MCARQELPTCSSRSLAIRAERPNREMSSANLKERRDDDSIPGCERRFPTATAGAFRLGVHTPALLVGAEGVVRISIDLSGAAGDRCRCSALLCVRADPASAYDAECLGTVAHGAPPCASPAVRHCGGIDH